MPRAKVVVGAHVTCYINGQPYGRASQFSFRSMTPRKAIYGLDSMDPYELAPTTTKVTGTLRIYRTVGDGGAEGGGLTVPYEDLPREKYFTVQLIDRGSDKVLFQAELCSVVSQSWDVPMKGVVSGTLEFEAISWSNELKALGSSS